MTRPMRNWAGAKAAGTHFERKIARNQIRLQDNEDITILDKVKA